MRQLVIIYVFFLAATVTAQELQHARHQLRKPRTIAGTECDRAPAGQQVCSSDCREVLLCMGSGSADEIIMLEECASGVFCNYLTSTCNASICVHPDENIKCHGIGFFPDPYDCTAYHICTTDDGAESTREQCDEGSAYNPLYNDCSFELTDDVCTEGPVGECTQLGATGAVVENPSIYYVCIMEDGLLVPSMYRCTNGQVYNATLYTCVDRPTAFSTDSMTVSRHLLVGHCSTTLEIIADPDDCARFYECSRANQWLRGRCLVGYHFDTLQRRCVPGAC